MLDRTAATRLADAWWARVCDIAPTPQHDYRELLAGLVIELAAALCSSPFTTEPALRAGAAVVELGLTDAAVLTRSTAALTELPRYLATPEHIGLDTRFPLVIAAFAQGFCHALQRETAAQARRAVTEAGDAAAQSESRFRAVFDNTDAAIFVTDLGGRFVETNPAMSVLLGRTGEQLRGAPAFEFLHPDDRAELTRRVYHELIVPGHGRLRFQMRFQRGDGTIAWIAGSLALTSAADGREHCLIGFGEDVTEARRLREELYWQARHDPLTKLPNRLCLRERLDAAVAASGPSGRIGMCFLDLDGFKTVNDRYGHGVGDRLLIAIAARLREAGGEMVSVVARLGGDEFVALIAAPVIEDRVVAVSRALLRAVAEPVDIAGRVLQVSASIGALSTKIGLLDADALLDAADEGLYRAKADARERISLQYNPSHEFPVLSR